ncbi:MAG: hypothetical protein KC619_35380 [Myxococcales bacterium]|nr:hypothetical protein [Myxococcales bacterium]
MRTLVTLAMLLTAGCGGAAAAATLPASAQDAEREAVELRITLPTALVQYARTQSVTVRDLGGHQVRVETQSRLHLRRQGTGEHYSVLRHQLYDTLEYRSDGEVEDPGPAMSGIEQNQVRSFVDRRGRIFEGPELAGESSHRQLSAAVLALCRLVEPQFPDGPVRVGASWSEPTVLWNTPPLQLAVLEIDRTWTLLGVEGEGDERRARIGWDVRIRLQPFEISGVSVSGQGRLEGFSLVSLADGVSGESALDLTMEVGPAGASDVLPLFRVEAKIRDDVAPAPGARRGDLVSGVPPIDPRGD